MPNTIMPLFILTTGGTIEKIYDEFEGALENKDTIVKNPSKAKAPLHRNPGQRYHGERFVVYG